MSPAQAGRGGLATILLWFRLHGRMELRSDLVMGKHCLTFCSFLGFGADSGLDGWDIVVLGRIIWVRIVALFLNRWSFSDWLLLKLRVVGVIFWVYVFIAFHLFTYFDHLPIISLRAPLANPLSLIIFLSNFLLFINNTEERIFNLSIWILKFLLSYRN